MARSCGKIRHFWNTERNVRVVVVHPSSKHIKRVPSIVVDVLQYVARFYVSVDDALVSEVLHTRS